MAFAPLSAALAAPDPRLPALIAALEQRGAHVRIDPAGDNAVQRVRTPAAAAAFGVALGDVVISAQGLPNLVHEAVHALVRGVIDDDHGIDYAAIPFDLGTESGRAVLFEELACCALSCALAHPRLARPRADDPWVRAWFAEQVEIQPVFYGPADALEAFAAAVDHVLAVAASACARVERLAFERFVAAVEPHGWSARGSAWSASAAPREAAASGSSDDVAAPSSPSVAAQAPSSVEWSRPLAVADLWARYRARPG